MVRRAGPSSVCRPTRLIPLAFAPTSVLVYFFPMKSHADMHSEEFLRELMRKQLRLSLKCALAFLVVLLGLPLANYFYPHALETRIFGFTLTWFILGVMFFPAVWLIAFVFIRRSIRLEEEEAAAAMEATDNPASRSMQK